MSVDSETLLRAAGLDWRFFAKDPPNTRWSGSRLESRARTRRQSSRTRCRTTPRMCWFVGRNLRERQIAFATLPFGSPSRANPSSEAHVGETPDFAGTPSGQAAPLDSRFRRPEFRPVKRTVRTAHEGNPSLGGQNPPPALLDEVERGGTVVITRHGRPIARLVPERTAARPKSTGRSTLSARSASAPARSRSPSCCRPPTRATNT